MTNMTMRIEHAITATGSGTITAGQQRQLLDLVPDDATISISESRGDQREGTSWTWRASWNNQQDIEWRTKTADAVLQPAAWSAVLEQFDHVDPRPAPLEGASVTQRDQERFFEWCGRQLDTDPIDIKIHFYVAIEDGRFGLVARAKPHAQDGDSVGRRFWEAARSGVVTEAGGLLADLHHPPMTQDTMADGKTPRCQAVSDGTHGYVEGSQCRRVANHSTLRNIVGHDYKRVTKG